MLTNIQKNLLSYVPNGTSIFAWETFFCDLAEADPLAPFMVMLAYFAILEDVEIPAACDITNYYDIAVEMASDDGGPVYEIAKMTGFIGTGIAQIIKAVTKGPVSDACLAEMVKIILKPERWDSLSQDNQSLTKAVQNPNRGKTIERTSESEWWQQYFAKEMLVNANTPTSILSYYLEAVLGQPCTIFCPLGWNEYERAGKEMASNDAALDAAIGVGLMATAVRIYFGAALDNEINWDHMRIGVEYLLNSSKLRSCIPYRERYFAEMMLQWTAGHEVTEDEWYAKYREIQRDFTDAGHGYVD